MNRLDQLVSDYGANDEQIKQIKKVADSEKEQIKELLAAEKAQTWTAGGYTVSRVVSEKETLNEDKLLPILKRYWSGLYGSMECPFIQTREYIDMDKLEAALYAGEIPPSTMQEMETCREVTTTISLRCKKAKEDK